MSRRILACAFVAFLLAVPSVVLGANDEKAETATTQQDYHLKSWVIAAAGFGWTGPGPIPRYGGTLGQPSPVGVGIGENNKLYSGFWGWFWPWIITPAVEHALPEVFPTRLHQNFPNPFNPSTTVEYSVAEEGPVEIAIFSIEGRRIRTLVDESRLPGRYSAHWDGTDDHGHAVATGVYLCRLQAESYSSAKKLLLLK